MEDQEVLSPEEIHEWETKFKLIHGHGGVASLVQALRQKQVGQPVLELAKKFRCEICEERKNPFPDVSVANLERWHVVLADCAFWRHPITNKRVTVGLMMDQGCRFLVGKILVEGESSSVKSEQYIKFYQEHWQQYFGHPEFLRFDAEGAWRSREWDEHFSKHQVMLDPIRGDAHWHLSPPMRSIAWLKELLSRLAQDDARISPHEAVAQAISIWNKREMVRGFSPFQHALGQAPDLEGRFFRQEVKSLPVDIMETPVKEMEERNRLRLFWQKRPF